MKKRFTATFLHEHWSNGKAFSFKGKKYKVHKMSYGEYFLESSKSKLKETEGFAPETIWLKRVDKKPFFYEVDE